MRISDGSSDVFFSDLIFRIPGLVFLNLFYEKCEEELAEAEQRFGIGIHRWDDIDLKNDMEAAFALTTQVDMVMSTSTSPQRIAEAVGKEVWLMSAAGSRLNQPPTGEYGMPHHLHWQRHRSEEHTSELQSLMRISYAVFCLKKKNHTTQRS